jgi:kynurenine formamidase
MDQALGEKKPSIAIHDVPLEWCFQPAVKLDFRHFPDGYVVTAADVESELSRIGHALQPLEIVVVNTRAGSRYGHNDYVAAGAGMGYEATMYLLERGVRLTGTDAWSWDAPFVHTAKKYAETGDASLIWEGHKAGRDIGYCHLEKLHNLEALPGDGFYVSCFPHKIRGASAGWTRASSSASSFSPESSVRRNSPVVRSTKAKPKQPFAPTQIAARKLFRFASSICKSEIEPGETMCVTSRSTMPVNTSAASSWRLALNRRRKVVRCA